MALTKQSVPLNFSQGLDLKTDPNQVQIGKFLTLTNSVFDKGGALTKRSGFPLIATLPNKIQTTLTTLDDSLIATGSNLYNYSPDTTTWLNKGTVQPIDLNVIPLVRVSTSQTSPDAAIAPNGLTCLVYVDNGVAYYQVSDSNTSQQIVARTTLPATSTLPRAFLLGQYFIITFFVTVSGATHLQYISMPIVSPSTPNAATDLSTNVLSNSTGYDGFIANNNLYFSWSGASTIDIAYLTSTLAVSSPQVIATDAASVISVTADTTASTAVIWVTYLGTSTGCHTSAFNPLLNVVLAPIAVTITTPTIKITSAAQNQQITIFAEDQGTYRSPYPGTVRQDGITVTVVTQAGVESSGVVFRSKGLASKAFIGPNQTIYVLICLVTPNQPTYFLMDSLGNVYMKLAYTNGGGFAASQVLPSVTLINNYYNVPYLITDFLATVNKGTNNPSGTPVNAIYTQTGINLAQFSINNSGQYSSEIAGALHLTGGQLWEYDGVKPVEHGFHMWPEQVAGTTSTTGGNIGVGTYYYQFTYEWTDAAGNLHRSAPSIPVVLTTTGSTSENTLYVSTNNLTYKVAPNPIRIVGYRWSVAQQVYYQFTSLTSPTLNNPNGDFVTITDTLADSSILGNTIIYTTGGVIEDIGAPACSASTLFKNRLFIVDAEDRNLLWYSKQVIEAVPVEMSDLLTLYVAPTTGAQGSTGPITALSAMDDKLIIFKRDAIYYVTGTGPDNTGASNDFTDPVYITASVGCANPNSIVLMPNGLMFQSDKGIWILGRDLSTNYIGAPVEAYNSDTVESAQAIPGTNQVRFLLGNNTTLMYDYYYGQWGTFSNINAVSSTLYQGAHTYLNAFGQVFQEKSGTYLDGTQPVLMSFTTSWINVAGLRGYERFYYFLLLGTYFTPFKLNVQLAYDYGLPERQITVTPDNQTPAWGGETIWGSGQGWGGPGSVLKARIFPQKMKCETFQLTISEIYDSSFGQAAGQGLTLSGLNLVVGTKKGYAPNKASQSFG